MVHSFSFLRLPSSVTATARLSDCGWNKLSWYSVLSYPTSQFCTRRLEIHWRFSDSVYEKLLILVQICLNIVGDILKISRISDLGDSTVYFLLLRVYGVFLTTELDPALALIPPCLTSKTSVDADADLETCTCVWIRLLLAITAVHITPHVYKRFGAS